MAIEDYYGIFGAHPGSWSIGGIALPDFGKTEQLGGNVTEEGGSNLIGQGVQSVLQYPVAAATGVNIGSGGTNYTAPTNNNNNNQQTPTNNNTGGNTGGGNTGGGNTGGGGGSSNFMDYYAGWNPDAARADFQSAFGGDINRLMQARGVGGGGGGGQSIEDMISEAYGPALQALGGIESSLLTSKEEALGNIAADYTGGQETIGREQTELEAALKEQGRRLSESARGAYADAIRAYNNLVQQGLSRFGAGSSAGPAVQELVNQEFLRSRGKMGQQELAGQQQLAQEETRLGNYVQQKKDDLDKWKRDAVTQINDNFRNAMAEINSRRADIEANKTRDKIAALQNAINQAQQVSTADKQFRMGLAQFAVEQMQNFAQRAFTPQEIASVVNDIMGQELGTFSERTSPAATQYRLPGYRSTTEEDEIKKLGQTT